MTSSTQRTISFQGCFIFLAVVFGILALLIIVPIHMAMQAIGAARMGWHMRCNGKRFFLTYNNWPVIKTYVEGTLLPKIESGACVLNWSTRHSWLMLDPLIEEQFLFWVKPRRMKGMHEPSTRYRLHKAPALLVVYRKWWKPRAFYLRSLLAAAARGETKGIKEMEAILDASRGTQLT